MDVIFCKSCKETLSIDKFSLRKNNSSKSGYSRYRTCDNCRKKLLSKNWKNKYSDKKFRNAFKKRQNDYNKRRFFYSRALTILNRNKKNNINNNNYSASSLAKLLASIWRKQNGLCALSDKKLTRENSVIDHIIPLNRGGDSSITNLRWITTECNSIKNTLLDEELYEILQKMLNKAKSAQ